MQNTANYGLNKPERTEFYNVEDFNENADIIDRELKALDSKKVNTADIVDNLLSTATDLPPSANQARVLNEKIERINNSVVIGVNLNNRDFNNLGETSFSGQGGNMLNGPIDDTTCNYLVDQIAGGGGTLLQFAKATNWSSGEVLYFRQRRSNGSWDKWELVITDTDLKQRWITQSTSVKGTISIDVNPYSAYQLFCQWAGANIYAIYYIDVNNNLVVLTNGTQDAWEVTLSTDGTKLNISNENSSNQWAKYRLLRLDY